MEDKPEAGGPKERSRNCWSSTSSEEAGYGLGTPDSTRVTRHESALVRAFIEYPSEKGVISARSFIGELERKFSLVGVPP